jgi:hypothetical protein
MYVSEGEFTDGHAFKFHVVASQGAGLVGEEIADLTKVGGH